ncbi:GNAT family N-acetyltransferase [Rummeliibacillus sp. TYF005]|uniref:GNAT family N-acetyltransferase n=1 Tax=Rummeliibacillus sp. TYF005 TaxID=2058214 RepID=UPI000F54C35A|nr:GNAT family N-acetyltransferase [Rummeliibacillus sp. TYF005]RPJ94330.1 GNAT family N-acetyltransferase [Rummeliibacillus sp. TYF005]
MNPTFEKVHKKDIHILKNLYSLYLHDLSRFTENLDIGMDGSFHFDDLEKLCNEEGFSSYFIKHEEGIIGFVLLLERPFLKKENDFGVNDIFILNKFRGKGFAKQSLEKLFKEKPGKYFVIELQENEPAILFWKKVYKQLNIKFDERKELIDDEPCLVQKFTV